MAWFKVDDKLHDHPKVLRLLRSNPERRIDPGPLALWMLAGAWCGDNKTDGFVPDYLLDRWSEEHVAHAERLVSVGLWELDRVDGQDGFRFHDWKDYNPTKDEVEANQAYNRRKAALFRDPELLAGIKKRDGDRCRYCGTLVRFENRSGRTGGTYDHVDPDGPNTLSNIVTACRGCNSAKGGRTPDEWGYRLLRPGSMGPMRAYVASLTAVPGTNQRVPSTSQSLKGSRPGRGRDGSGPGYVPSTDEAAHDLAAEES